MGGVLFLLIMLLASLSDSEVRDFRPRSGETYVEYETMSRMIFFRGTHEECDIYGDYGYIQKVVNSSVVVYVDRSIMSNLLDLCQDVHLQLVAFEEIEDDTENRRRDYSPNRKKSEKNKHPLNSLWSMNVLNSILIFPGTKWCGQGAIAEHYDDIGYHAETDRCCRSHDLCLTVTGEYLSPGDCKNGLCNYSPVTRSPCQCDRQFVHCLRSAKTKLSNALGRLFFNIAGSTCYKYEHPVTRCSEYAHPQKNRFPPWILRAMHINLFPRRPRCKRYELDRSKPKIWQFFETFYEENNDRSEEPRSIRLPLFQRFFLDIFMSLVDPIRRRRITIPSR